MLKKKKKTNWLSHLIFLSFFDLETQYPFFLWIKSEDGNSSISRLSEPHQNFIPWAKKTQCIRYSISMSPIPIKWMLISSHKHWFCSHTNTSFIFSSTLVWKRNNFSKSKGNNFSKSKVLPSLYKRGKRIFIVEDLRA